MNRWLVVVCVVLALPVVAQQPEMPFRIHVVDAATGRGVPLVELETVHHVVWVTDSAGRCAIGDPELFGRKVFFHVRSHGYEVPADGFGYRGFACAIERGGEHVVQIERINIAERLYRVTGAGIYRDTVLLGERAPIRDPLIDGGVFGQDSVVNAIYRGRLWWFWGDTNRAAYPLGNFAVTGATSRLPGDGGLGPGVGVDFDYFVGDDGFARRMCPIDGPGPVWIFGLMVVEHQGRERMLAHYQRMKNLGTRHEHGIVVWNDATERFDKAVQFPLEGPLHPSGNPVRVGTDGDEWFVFPHPYPSVRVPANFDAILDPSSYEAFSCLLPGTRWEKDEPPFERDTAGALRWGWKADTDVVSPEHAASAPGWMNLRDVETGEPIRVHGGTFSWNAHRRRWIAIVLQVFGRSVLGEVWFAEADTLLGPWSYARRIVTHDRYSFYNVKQHPYFDEDGGRLVYFEGTYTAMFSGNPAHTPRYDYNQMMYRLDLDDPRLELPVPVYRVCVGDDIAWLVGDEVAARGAWGAVEAVPFHAMPAASGARRFRALPAEGDDHPATVELFRWTRAGSVAFHVRGERPPGDGWKRDPEPLGRVFRSPHIHPPLWPSASPAGG